MFDHIKSRTIARIAQLAEQLICNQQVVGSIPTAGSSIFSPGLIVSLLSCG